MSTRALSCTVATVCCLLLVMSRIAKQAWKRPSGFRAAFLSLAAWLSSRHLNSLGLSFRGCSKGTGRRVRFETREPVLVEVPDVPEHRRNQLWWQPEDFVDFLRVRLEIASAYKAAAQTLGVEMFNVCSVGPHAKEAYRATIEAYPSLKDESRRGLGLGRRHQRAQNRDAYIAAVVQEQRRQHYRGVQNAELLARVAQEVSKKDQDYAHFLANMYFEQEHADESEGIDRVFSGDTLVSEESNSPKEAKAVNALALPDATPSNDSAGAPLSSPRDPKSTKGFGLSREILREVGLSATGHSLSKSQLADAETSDPSSASESGSDFE
ncbi:unnamed protein product [Effrenium voratum]|nr:unnamed protein product [Effrenium voratum]CAJ1449498.1 unnamed protein product [Effrenium voratum]